jgi:RHS repeat-associated protein
MSSPVVTYAYDAAGSGTVNVGRRTSMSESSGGSESWAYTINKATSPMGLLVSESRTSNSVNHTSAYQYNYDGSVGSILYPSGRTVTYTYNGAAQATAATDIANSTSYVSNGYYGPSGVLMLQSLGGAINHTILYNTRLQPCWSWAGTGNAVPTTDTCTSTATAGNILDLKYNYNLGTDNGNLVSITNNRDSTRSQTFSYDSVKRLSTAAASTYATSPGNCWGEQFGYDTAGNWGNLLSISAISSAYSGCTQENMSLTANAYNRITTLTYDSAGNTTTIPGSGGGSYTFNAENLITTTAGVSYTYDGDNKRVETVGSSLYWYGPDGTELADSDLTGSTTNSAAHDYVYFNGVRTARRDNVGDAFYYLDDQIGSVRAIAEVVSGQTTASLCFDTDYYPYGTQRGPIVSSCTTSQKFTGKHIDTESSLYDSDARFYNPMQGRFMSPDPLGLLAGDPGRPQSWNLYAYVMDNPINAIDPNGLWCVWEDGTHDDDEKDGGASESECRKQGGHWDASDTVTGIFTDKSGNITAITTGSAIYLTGGRVNTDDIDSWFAAANYLGLSPLGPPLTYQQCVQQLNNPPGSGLIRMGSLLSIVPRLNKDWAPTFGKDWLALPAAKVLTFEAAKRTDSFLLGDSSTEMYSLKGAATQTIPAGGSEVLGAVESVVSSATVPAVALATISDASLRVGAAQACATISQWGTSPPSGR